MFNYFYNVKKYFSFDRQEIKSILLMIITFTFVLGFDDGYSEFILSRWLFNFLTSFVIASSAVLVKETAHKLMAIKQGYTVKMKLWWPIMLVNLFLVFLVDGKIHIMLPMAGLFIFHHERMRIGEFRYGHNYFENALIGFAGPLANVYLAAFFKLFMGLNNPAVFLAMQVNLIYAVINLIPVDILLFFVQSPKMLEHADIRKHPAPFAGTYILYSTRIFYVFCVTVVSILSAFIFISGIIPATITALIMGIVVFFALWFMHDFNVV
ncbi:MAG: hypothetical protein ACOCUR_00630 [Nanoarchaeota archaeon]